MSSIGSGYDLSAATFSPDGRVFQVEYAMKAVDNSSTAIGIKCTDGVILAVEKLLGSKLHEPSSNTRIFKIDDHIGMTIAGLIPDARSLVEYARDEATSFRSNYGRLIPLKTLAYDIARMVHAYTRHGSVRPFGCAIIMSSWLQDKPDLWMIDPSGATFGYEGCAAGKARQNAKTELEKLKKNMTMEDGIKEAARIIHSIHDEVKDREFELQMTWVGKDQPRHMPIPTEILKRAEAAAKEALADSDSDEDM